MMMMISVGRRVALCVVLILYSHEFLVLLLGNCVIAHSLYPNSVGRLKFYHPSNKVDTSSECWIITHVICIHCARVNLTFGVFIPKSGIHTVNACWLHIPDIKFIDLLVFLIIWSQIRDPVDRQPASPRQSFCVLLVGASSLC